MEATQAQLSHNPRPIGTGRNTDLQTLLCPIFHLPWKHKHRLAGVECSSTLAWALP